MRQTWYNVFGRLWRLSPDGQQADPCSFKWSHSYVLFQHSFHMTCLSRASLNTRLVQHFPFSARKICIQPPPPPPVAPNGAAGIGTTLCALTTSYAVLSRHAHLIIQGHPCHVQVCFPATVVTMNCNTVGEQMDKSFYGYGMMIAILDFSPPLQRQFLICAV